MQAVKRHEVQALMGEAHKAAENVAVSALTREVKRLMKGRAGAPAEVRAANVEKAYTLVNAAEALTEEPAARAALASAALLLSEAVEAGEPESKHGVEPAEEFFGGMLVMPKA